MKANTIFFSLIIAAMIIIMSGCSTTRDNFFSKTYHQTTAKYNGFFNAKESVNIGLKKIKNNHQENYQDLLPLSKINQRDNIDQVFPNMDRAIEKTINVIVRHSMEINGEEQNQWIDDNYFLMAQARFYKKEYLAALNTFKHIIRTYTESELRNRALIWSAECDVRLENFQTAERTLKYLLNDNKNITKQEYTHANQVMATIEMGRKNFKKATISLIKSLEHNNNRSQKARTHFILGQLYERLKRGDEAIQHYNKVVALNPEYEMSFRASLNKAIAYASSSGSPKELLKEYYKMLKDVKNKEYRDQIYYALGEINLNDGDTTSAIENYKQSLLSFLFNVDQKLQTHFRLSKIYLKQKQYKPACIQHDSIIMLINTGDNRYLKTKTIYKNLKELVKNQDIIHEGDSLLGLAYLPEEERNKKIDEYIEELKAKDLAEKETSKEGDLGGGFNLYEYNRNQANIPTSGGWYFYNPTAMSFGYSEFLTRWGNRKNENNWRRKNKNQMDLGEVAEVVKEEGPSEKEKYSREYYLSQIPLTKEKQELTLKKIEKAYYNLATQLKNKFLDYNFSVDTYEEMLTRFKETEYKLLVYMQLVFLYEMLDEAKARGLILKNIQKEFPNNKYINPITGEALMLKEENKTTEYEKIYNLYIKQEYSSALLLINEVLAKDVVQDSLNIKMIEAFCVSKESGKKEFIELLEKIKTNHSGSIQGKKSSEILDVLYGSFYETELDTYTINHNTEHHVIIMVTDLKINIPELQNMIAKYNTANFGEKSLKSNNLLLNKETQIIKIAKFKNSKQAMNYYQTTLNHPDWSQFFQGEGLEKMIISNDNFIALLKEKSIIDYRKYFNEKYLN